MVDKASEEPRSNRQIHNGFSDLTEDNDPFIRYLNGLANSNPNPNPNPEMMNAICTKMLQYLSGQKIYNKVV